MSLNGIINDSREKILKYRYLLIAILAIIIILLILLIGIIIKVNNNKNNSNLEIANHQNEEEDIMLVELDNKKKEEEERAREKQEEENAKGIIYLTFDDGPSSDATPKILEILERKNIKATFFVVHYNEKNQEFVKREADSGHTVALHGYTHTYSEVYSSVDTCMDNFRRIQEQVYQTTGRKSNIIRFPGGSSNTISRKYCQGVMTELSKRVVDEGFRYFDWNVDSDDAGHAKTSEDVYHNVTSGIKENRKNIVLMHDFSGNDKTVNALEGIINYGLENGFVFRKITEETPMVTHSVNN